MVIELYKMQIRVLFLDIDECLRPNNCSQVCENTVGSFTCRCRQGFELEADGEQCRGKVIM